MLILMIAAAAAMRLVSYKFPFILSNVTPVGAIALFGGVYFTEKWKAYLVVLVALFSSDLLINYLYTGKWVLYSGSFWVYLTFAIMVFIGSFIKKASIANVSIAALLSVTLHWLLTDLPWLYGTLYQHSLTGYVISLNSAIPFEVKMILGDLVFCTILFGGFELVKSKYTFLRSKQELAV